MSVSDKRTSFLTVVYPVTYTFEDGSTLSVDSREELREAFKAFKEENPNVSDRPSLV